MFFLLIDHLKHKVKKSHLNKIIKVFLGTSLMIKTSLLILHTDTVILK